MKINNIDQAVILAGGLGKRLRPLTNSIPKPMTIVNRYPFLDYIIRSIVDIKIKNILIAALPRINANGSSKIIKFDKKSIK